MSLEEDFEFIFGGGGMQIEGVLEEVFFSYLFFGFKLSFRDLSVRELGNGWGIGEFVVISI